MDLYRMKQPEQKYTIKIFTLDDLNIISYLSIYDNIYKSSYTLTNYGNFMDKPDGKNINLTYSNVKSLYNDISKNIELYRICIDQIFKLVNIGDYIIYKDNRVYDVMIPDEFKEKYELI